MRLSLESAALTVELGALERVCAVHGSLHIPLQQIDRASDEVPARRWAEVRAPGTYIPGLIKAGTYWWPGRKEFWFVTRGRSPLTLHLRGGPYTAVVLGVDDASGWVRRINERLATSRAGEGQSKMAEG